MKEIISFLKSHLIQCPTKATLDINCLGCGLQRSFVLLLEGKIVESFVMYPALLPIVLMWLYLIVHLILKFKNGSKILMYLYICNSILITINYIIKL
ncbi:DUF2752 domain-containing protein [Aquimarina algicola]|uniref:DUF2752 domain-containing protein n=1 Tax=Aquimarina algicola TaxID=2589995 RepID=A0A504J1J3_9FLAO|nr:DUF2752 domain-containing protein [Aquimarina algicola]